MSRNEADWEKIVLVCIIILVIVAVFKFLFWLSVAAIVIGGIWIIINLFSEEHDCSGIPLIMIICGIVLGCVSYKIGYDFEKSEIGKPIVDGAKRIVQIDNTINEIKQNTTNQILDATIQVTKNGSKEYKNDS